MKKALLFISKHILTLFFIGVIFSAFFMSFMKSADKIDENRRMAEFPTKMSLNFPKEFENYYLDSFPNRKKLVRRYNKIRFKKFGINNYLLLGDDGWLFFNSRTKEKTDIIADYLGINLFSERLLEDNINHLMKQIKAIEAIGADVYVMIPPNKATVYPELMPDNYKGRKADVSKADQVIKALKQKGVKVIEVKDAIINAKDEHITYLRTDTHWNRFGAFVAYKEAEKALKASNKISDMRSIDIKKITQVDFMCGDLQRYLFGVDKCVDVNFDIEYRRPVNVKCENVGKGNLDLNAEVSECYSQNKNGKKLLVIRDSFAVLLMPLLSSHFEKSTYLWRGFVSDEEIVETIKTEKPDVVILEYLERFLLHIGDKIFE